MLNDRQTQIDVTMLFTILRRRLKIPRSAHTVYLRASGAGYIRTKGDFRLMKH
jgi:hypothetical protein